MNTILERGCEREIPAHKLRILKLQSQRLERWVGVGSGGDRRTSDRAAYADVVYLMPLDAESRPKVECRFAAFCRNISRGGCGILRNRLLEHEDWAVFFPHLRPMSPEPACFVARVAHDRPVPLGMYEIGLEFKSVMSLDSCDISRMVAKDGDRAR